MIVVCEGCERRFQVDDARIPARGARVRCKRCKHRFRVYPPNGAEAEAVETSVPPSAAPGASAGPAHAGTSASDRATSEASHTESRPSEPAAGDVSNETSGDQTLLGQSLSEGELRFVTDVPEAPERPAGEDAPAEAEGAADEAWEFADSALSSGGEAEAPEPPAEPSPAGTPVDGENTLGQLYGVDPEHTMDPSAPIEDDPEAIERPTPGSGPDPNFFDLEATGSGPELAGGEIPATPAEDPAAPGGAPEIGSAADWDRLAADGAEAPDAPAGEPLRSDEAEAPPLDGLRLDDEDDDDTDLSFELDLPAVVPDAGARARSAWLEHAGWALSLVLLLAVAQGSVRIEPEASDVPPGQVEVAGLRAENVRGHFVENARSGPLYVVSGELRNAGPRARRAEGRLQVVLLDAEDRPLARPPALVGTALPEAAVRETPVGALALQEPQRAEALAGRSLAPGESVAFHAVLAEVSEEAARFRIETVPEEPRRPARGPVAPVPGEAPPPPTAG